MNFKLKSCSMLLAGAALGLTACSNDTLDVNGGSEGGGAYSGKKLYLTAGVSLPNDAYTRSATDDGFPGNTDDNDQTNSNGNGSSDTEDFEYGYDYENDVRTMILVFATDGTKDTPAGKDKFLCYSMVSGLEKAPTGSQYSFEVLAELKYEDLEKIYDQTQDNDNNLYIPSQDVHVYAYCNYTANLKNLIENATVGSSDFLDWNGTVTEAASGAGQSPTVSSTIWADRSFLMTNYALASTKFPETLADWDDYADESTPFRVTADGEQALTSPLSPIKVERSAARIDFRDGSKDLGIDGNPDNTYPIMTDVHELGNPDNATVDGNKNLFSVQLTRMALVNMSNQFYYLRRVSADGTATGATVLGVETASNYVVDVDADDKNAQTITSMGDTPNSADHFNFCLYDNDGNYAMNQWFIDDITDVLGSSKHDDTWTGSENNRYKIWRYVTENTIPGANNQITVQSTGVVFKGRIVAGKDIDDTYSTTDAIAQHENYVSEAVRDALSAVNGDSPVTTEEAASKLPVLYSFDGFLYAGWEELVDMAVADGIGGTLFTAVGNILENWKKADDDATEYKYNEGTIALTVEEAYNIVHKTSSNTISDIDDTKVSALAPAQNITVYRVSKENDNDGYGYYCYYFYWNRHNDNDKSGLMGNMEFATVRNNVYKLAVKSISKFGHPRDKDDDPDPEDEKDPDEKPTRYLQVDVEVLPWVVRVNDIKF